MPVRVKRQHRVLNVAHQLDVLAFLVVVLVNNVCYNVLLLVSAQLIAQKVLGCVRGLIGVKHQFKGRVVVHYLAWDINLLERLELLLLLDHVLHQSIQIQSFLLATFDQDVGIG